MHPSLKKLVLTVPALAVTSNAAADDIVFDFSSRITGESEHTNYEDWIEAGTLALGVSRTISQVGGGGDRETSCCQSPWFAPWFLCH